MKNLYEELLIIRKAYNHVKAEEIEEVYSKGKDLLDVLYLQWEYAQEIGNNQIKVSLSEIAIESQDKLLRSIQHIANKLEKAERKADLRAIDMYGKQFAKIDELQDDLFAFSGRNNLKMFALYIEKYRNKKVWDKTMQTVESVFHYGNKMINEEDFRMLRVSLQPGIGKSYIGNLIVANMLGNNPSLSILRITFSDDLVQITTSQTKEIINSSAFKRVFRRYENIENVFKRDKIDSFRMCDSEDENNFFAVTRDGQATGKRAKVVIIDDYLKGQSEANSITLQKQLIDRYDSDWSSRADDSMQKTILLGTMWSPYDLLNVLYDRECEDDSLIPSQSFKYTEISKDNKSAFIGIPALDDNEKSTCPRRFSTDYLLKKKKNMDTYLWAAVYMQQPIAPEGLEFTWNLLEQYDTLPSREVLETTYASLDPARKGKNYVSMPIVNKYANCDKYYLVDFLYQKKSMEELYDSIVDKVINNDIKRLVVENNTDTSLKRVLDDKLKEKGHYTCQIEEMYSYQNKEQRIKDNQGGVRNAIVYPRKQNLVSSSDLSKAMESITSYSFDYPNKYDDGIDSIVLLLQHFKKEKAKFYKIGTLERSYYGI